MTKLLLLMLALYACNSASKSDPEEKDWRQWQIDVNTYRAMRDAYRTCPHSSDCDLKNYKENKQAMDKIRARFPEADYDYNWVYARYRAADEGRYKANRPRKNHDWEKVAGYATKVLQVLPKTDKIKRTDIFYFDCLVICPPPTGVCDLSDYPD